MRNGRWQGFTHEIHRQGGVLHRLYTGSAHPKRTLSPNAGPKPGAARICVWKKNVERVLEEKVGKYVILCVGKGKSLPHPHHAGFSR